MFMLRPSSRQRAAALPVGHQLDADQEALAAQVADRLVALLQVA
jgi:hypothetical protein